MLHPFVTCNLLQSWVQYSLYHKGEADKVGEALIKLEDQWHSVPREALANWLKLVLMTELANTLLRVDAVNVTLEMPLGSTVSNDQVHECLSAGFINVAIVAPRPTSKITFILFAWLSLFPMLHLKMFLSFVSWE